MCGLKARFDQLAFADDVKLEMTSAEFISESISFDTVSLMTRPKMCRFCSQDLIMDCAADHSGKPCLIGKRYSSIGHDDELLVWSNLGYLVCR